MNQPYSIRYYRMFDRLVDWQEDLAQYMESIDKPEKAAAVREFEVEDVLEYAILSSWILREAANIMLPEEERV